MGVDPATIGLVVGLASVAASGAGAVAQYSSSRAAARNQEAIANFNARIQSQNALHEMRVAQLEAGANARFLQGQAAAQQANALTLRRTADAEAAQAREQSRRTRMDNARFQALQRARIARSGVLETGSPLDILAETAGVMELALQDAHYEANLKLTKGYRQAQLEEYGAGQTLFDAGMKQLEGEAAGVKYRMDLRQAEIARLTGLAQAGAMKSMAGANLLSGLSETGTSAYTLYRGGAFTPKRKTL